MFVSRIALAMLVATTCLLLCSGRCAPEADRAMQHELAQKPSRDVLQKSAEQQAERSRKLAEKSKEIVLEPPKDALVDCEKRASEGKETYEACINRKLSQ
jgi:hypothetical protein